MIKETLDLSSIIHTPDEVAALAKQRVEFIRNNQHRTLKFFIPGMTDYIAPLLPGEMTMILAQTSNYKSGFMDAWEFAAAKQLEQEGRNDEVIVHISVEESVEQQVFRLLARETGLDVGQIARGNITNWDDFTYASVKVGDINIYRIGHSLMNPGVFPKLHMSNMIRAIEYLQDKLLNRKLTIAGLFFDYLQAFPFDDEVKRAQMIDRQKFQIREDVYRIFQAANYFNCPAIVNSQAKQTLDNAPSKSMYIPGIYDGDGAKEVADRPDRVFSLWMPKMTHAVGTYISYGGADYRVEENILWVKACKQRGGLPSGRAFRCRIDFNQNRILLEQGQ